MLLNPTVANLHNLKTNRFHPIIFGEAPQPSYKTDDILVRSKSSGHHTDGFDTREESIKVCEKLAEDTKAKLSLGKDFAWDGEETPAMIVFFGEKNGDIIPLI